jgi:hypothetical protein
MKPDQAWWVSRSKASRTNVLTDHFGRNSDEPWGMTSQLPNWNLVFLDNACVATTMQMD